jgi:DNA-binding MarR family transcriptional regulator
VSSERELSLLSAIAGRAASQRDLSKRVGLSLGGVNEALRSLIKRGLVRAVPVNGRTRSYELTPTGAAERARLSRATAKRAVLELLAEPGLPESAKDPASRLIAALGGSL